MKSSSQQPRPKGKKIVKERKINRQDKPERQEMPSSLSHVKNMEKSPEEIRKQLAQQALKLIQPPKSSLKEDDFFFVEPEENKKIDNNDQLSHEAMTQKINEEYLRKHHRYYEDLSEEYKSTGYGNPIEYKGHTLCITSFQVTDTQIYSCSKDKSIIQWDRETGKKQFISLGKDPNHHRSDILSLTLHPNQQVVATAADDCQIKLWDTRSCSLIDTLRGHKNTINGIKFGINSHNLCSVSADLTLKHWDFAQRGLIGTYYEHNAEILDLDHFNSDDFITSGYDKQVITWKTEKQTKVVFKGHSYAIDRVRTINQERFVTACQDGSVYLWNTRKTKPIFKCADAHSQGWISAMDNIKQSNVLATGGIDKTVKIWGIQGDNKGLNLLQEMPVNGIVTDLKLTPSFLAVAECDELRLGRWVTTKCRNKIKIFPRLKEGQ